MGRALEHPNIVPIFEVDSDSHASWIVMEFIEGQNLREFLKSRNRFEPDEAIRLASTSAAASTTPSSAAFRTAI